MPKSIQFEHRKVPTQYPYDRVRVTMHTWAWGRWGQRETKQFTIGLADLIAALKQAELYQEVPVPTGDHKVLAEIALYHALTMLDASAGTKTLSAHGETVRSKLWNRITKALNL